MATMELEVCRSVRELSTDQWDLLGLPPCKAKELFPHPTGLAPGPAPYACCCVVGQLTSPSVFWVPSTCWDTNATLLTGMTSEGHRISSPSREHFNVESSFQNNSNFQEYFLNFILLKDPI